MSLVLDLTEELEHRLRQKAEQQGLAPETCAVRLLECELAERPAGELSDDELLLEATRGLPESVWEPFHRLVELRERDETLSDDQHRELLRLNAIVESSHAKRMEYAAEIAIRRGIPLRAVMDELGFPNYGSL